ncbi:tRNA pseudouridine(13) synthase TruD [Persephonella sp.]|uniref:tRNA pseudouridine(13) synthase TruD n=1 Tax=Persephonella sp. TaxID=2060922 RepID=UPI0026156A3B|nr:tRNA pseudouridine(13) synthase TruD [Persephonella sp.]
MNLEKHIKQKPSDFIVEEVFDYKLSPLGKYQLYQLKKINLSTLQVVRFLSGLFKIKPSEIGFAGLKDKFAITTQYLSFPLDLNIPDSLCFVNKAGRLVETDKLDFYKQQGFCIKKIGYIDNPINLGDNKGNNFTIKVTNLTKNHKKLIYENLDIVKKYGCANYFGEQRFGSVKGRNDFIFKYLLEEKYEKALKTYFSIKGNIKNWGNWERLYKDLKGNLEQYEKDLILGLKRGLTPEKAIRILSKNIRLMFNFAFQSYLWNEYLRKYIEAKYPYKRVPFIHNWKLSFYLEVDDIEYLKNLEISYTAQEYKPQDRLLQEIIEETLWENNVHPEYFEKEVAGIKVLTDGLRKAIFFPENLKIKGKTKNSITLSFFLPTGSYATILLRNLLS